MAGGRPCVFIFEKTEDSLLETQDLKKAGLKVTLPRMKILELLQNADRRHLSAEDIYKLLLDADEEIGLATIYRVLTQFEAAGLVTRHHFESGQAVFELERGEHHDHLVCIKCGKVEEFKNDTIESCQDKIAQEAGYRITDHSLIIYGVCPDCQKKTK
jgi:Fur family ferric uptake transcriptional regulator